MKKSKFYIYLCILLVFPLCFIATGCGATPVNLVKSVCFVSDSYDENGNAVFEFDLGKTYKLPYKVNPSSAYGYTARYVAVSGVAGDNSDVCTLSDNGYFTLEKIPKMDIKIKIVIGNFDAFCVIRYKEYPTNVGFYDELAQDCINSSPEINLACGSSYQINIAAKFENDDNIKILNDNEYGYFVEIDDNAKTLINIPNRNRLIFSAYNNCGSANIKVSICDGYGEPIEDLTFLIKVNICKKCSDISAKIGGADKFVFLNDENKTLDITWSDLNKDEESSTYEMSYDCNFYDENLRVIDKSNIIFQAVVNNTDYIDIDFGKNLLIINKPLSEELSFELKIWSNLLSKTNAFSSITLKINITN